MRKERKRAPVRPTTPTESGNAEEDQPAEPAPIVSCSVLAEHTYHIPRSPQSEKRKVERVTQRKDEEKKLKRARKQLLQRRQRRFAHYSKIISLKELLLQLQKEDLLDKKSADVISECFSDESRELLDRIKNPSNKQYCNTLKSFALTLNFYSPAAYRFLREEVQFSLPCLTTVWRLYNSVDGRPGFSSEALEVIKQRVKDSPHTVYGTVMFNEMSIESSTEWDGSQFVGCVDLGGVRSVEQCEGQEAREALVVMFVALNAAWKIPIGYYLIYSINADEKTCIIRTALYLLHRVGVEVVAIAFDGQKSNFVVASNLGASLSLPNLVPNFPHPVTKANVYCMVDACDMLKFIRNLFGDFKELVDYEGRTVSWNYIEKLNNVQKREGLVAGNKIKVKRVNFTSQKMKVHLAVQVLSSYVSNALEVLETDLKDPSFKGARATAHFCFLFDKLFDVLNSRNPYAKGSKSVLRISNENSWSALLSEAENYIQGLQNTNGDFLCEGPRKLGLIGFICLCRSIKGLFHGLCKRKKIQYLPTYKFSLDHLQIYFSMIRSRLGFNYNPSVLQFRAAWKSLLQNEVRAKTSGNCLPQDDTKLLCCDKGNTWDLDPVIFGNLRRLDLEPESSSINECEGLPGMDLFSDNLTEYSNNIVVYIAGFVARRVSTILKCPECIECLTTRDAIPSSDLHIRKNNGGLYMPSQGLVFVCRQVEKLVRSELHKASGKLQSDKTRNRIQQMLLMNLVSCKPFPNIIGHIRDNVFPENHEVRLLKCISNVYITVRCHHVAKVLTFELHKKIVRQCLTKSILFKNQ